MKKILYLILFLTLILFGCTFYQRAVGQVEFGDYTRPKIEATAEKVSKVSKISERSEGKASWYDYSLPGYPNYSKENYTVASRDYPRGTELLVCRTDAKINLDDIREVVGREKESRIFLNQSDNINKCVKVRVNDYGPEHCDKNKKDTCPERIIDLSSKAFQELAPLSKGIIDVKIIKL